MLNAFILSCVFANETQCNEAICLLFCRVLIRMRLLRFISTSLNGRARKDVGLKNNHFCVFANETQCNEAICLLFCRVLIRMRLLRFISTSLNGRARKDGNYRHLLYFVVKQAVFAGAGRGAFPSAADWKAHDKEIA